MTGLIVYILTAQGETAVHVVEEAEKRECVGKRSKKIRYEEKIKQQA